MRQRCLARHMPRFGAYRVPYARLARLRRFATATVWSERAFLLAASCGSRFKAFSEARLLSLGFAFEQAMPARALPVTTPELPGETITY